MRMDGATLHICMYHTPESGRMCFRLPMVTFTLRRGIFEPRGNLTAGASRSNVGIRAKERWGMGDKDCDGSERAVQAASTAEQTLRKKEDGT